MKPHRWLKRRTCVLCHKRRLCMEDVHRFWLCYPCGSTTAGLLRKSMHGWRSRKAAPGGALTMGRLRDAMRDMQRPHRSWRSALAL